jgi:hypothetical protein
MNTASDEELQEELKELKTHYSLFGTKIKITEQELARRKRDREQKMASDSLALYSDQLQEKRILFKPPPSLLGSAWMAYGIHSYVYPCLVTGFQSTWHIQPDFPCSAYQVDGVSCAKITGLQPPSTPEGQFVYNLLEPYVRSMFPLSMQLKFDFIQYTNNIVTYIGNDDTHPVHNAVHIDLMGKACIQCFIAK